MIQISKEKFIGKCEDVLCQKIDKALEKNRLVSYLTDGCLGAKTNDVRLIKLMIDDLNEWEIYYNLETGLYNLEYYEAGDIMDDLVVENAEEYVNYFLDEVL